MKKKLLIRSLLGAPIGLSINVIITVLISLTFQDGNYYAVVPELIADCGNEINAVLLQAGLSLLYGAVFAASSLIWELDSWSLLKQTVTHLLVVSITTLPIAYFMHWMSHTWIGVLVYFGIFFAIYAIIWIFQYSSIKKQIKQINNQLNQK